MGLNGDSELTRIQPSIRSFNYPGLPLRPSISPEMIKQFHIDEPPPCPPPCPPPPPSFPLLAGAYLPRVFEIRHFYVTTFYCVTAPGEMEL